MKILFDQQIFSQQLFGGISRYYTELAKEFCNINSATAKIVSPLCTNPYVRCLPADCLLGIPVAGGKAAQTVFRYVNEKVARLVINRYRPDIIHQTYYPKKVVNYVPGPKLVTTIHDMIYELFPKNFSARDRTAAYKKRALRDTDHVICISENTRRDLIRLTDIEPARTSVIHLGADHLQLGEVPVSNPSGRPYVLYVGERSEYKNFQRLLKAYVRLPGLMRDYNLVCFGGGPLREAEKQLAQTLNVPAQNLLLVNGSDRVLAGLYQHAEVFIYPSLYEGFGIPPLEAMAQGCPVISSNAASLPEVLGKAAEYFNPAATDDLMRSLENVLNDAGRAGELRRLGCAQAEKFTWRKCAEQTLKAYVKVCREQV